MRNNPQAPVTPEVTYDASLEAFRKASREFRLIREDYRTRKIGDEEFLKGKTIFDKASEVADKAETAYIEAKAIPTPSPVTPKVTPPLTHREFIAQGKTEADWDIYAVEQNRLSRERGQQQIIELWQGEGVSGNDITNLLRPRGITIPPKISPGLQHSDTVVSSTSVTGRGMSRTEASAIHKWVSEQLGKPTAIPQAEPGMPETGLQPTPPNPSSGNPTGTCYPDSWRYVMRHTEGVLVHGTAISLGKRINHAWVELPDGTVWEPSSQAILSKERYYALVDPVVEDRYTADEAAHMLSVGKHGPWTEEEKQRLLGGNPMPKIESERQSFHERIFGKGAVPPLATLKRGMAVNKMLPMPPESGPPLPRALELRWPWRK